MNQSAPSKTIRPQKPGQVLIAAGCLSQRSGEQLVSLVPSIDGILGTRRWMDIVNVAHQVRPGQPKPFVHLPAVQTIGTDELGVPRVAIQGGSAYLKIADGCRRTCAFCAIPLIKGTAVSRPVQAVVHDAQILRDSGVQEIILIAQDTTDYGHDLGMEDGLPILLENLLKTVPDLPWIRIMYAFPGYVTRRLIDLIASNQQILHYLDIPLQHADPLLLRSMKRPADLEWVHKTVSDLRCKMPDIAIRSTFIVGYPGETEKEFQELVEFIQEMKFDRVGVFPFSFEIGTPSVPLGDPIPDKVKQSRVAQLMSTQQNISLAKTRI